MFITISYLSPFKRIIIQGERTPQLLRLREKPQPQHQRGKWEKERKDRRRKEENPAPLLVSPHRMVGS